MFSRRAQHSGKTEKPQMAREPNDRALRVPILIARPKLEQHAVRYVKHIILLILAQDEP